MDSDWISGSPHLYKLVLGDKVFAPRLKRRPWTTYSLEEVFNNRGDTLNSMMEVKDCLGELLKKLRLFHFSLEASLTNFIKKRGTDDLKEALDNVNQDPIKFSKETAFILLAEIYDAMLLDQDLLESYDIPVEQLRFEPFFTDKYRNQYYYFGWQYIFRVDGQRAGTSSDVSTTENGDGGHSAPPVIAVASSADEFQKIFQSVSRRGEQMSTEIIEILKTITIYKRSLPVVRFKSARLIRKQEAIKNERVLAAKAAIEAMKNGKEKPTIEEIDEVPLNKEDIRFLQQQKRAERYARRMRTKESVSPATLELIKTSENGERPPSSASNSNKSSEKQCVDTDNKSNTSEDAVPKTHEEINEENINSPTDERQKRIDETIQEVVDRVLKRKLSLETDLTSADSVSTTEQDLSLNGGPKHALINGNNGPSPKKFIPVRLSTYPNAHSSSYYNSTIVPLHTVRRNGGIPTKVATPKVVYRNIFDPNDPRNAQPRTMIREVHTERTVVPRVQGPSGFQRRIVHLTPRVVVPIRNNTVRSPAPIIRRIVYTTNMGSIHSLPPPSMHNGRRIESQNPNDAVV